MLNKTKSLYLEKSYSIVGMAEGINKDGKETLGGGKCYEVTVVCVDDCIRQYSPSQV